MLATLAVGTALIAATVVIHTVGLVFLSRTMSRLVRWFRLHRHTLGRTVAMVATVLGLFALHTIEIWLWAASFLVLRIADAFPDALYLSTVSFSTMGAGEAAVGHAMRMLIALESMNGFILIGWSIAYLIAASTRHGPFRPGEHF